MIFAQHHSGSLVDAARSVEGVLLLGRLGQGAGLLNDVLAAAAAESGLPASRDELHGYDCLRPLSAAAVWLGASEVPQDAGRFDVVVVLDQAASSVAYRLVKPSGRILLPYSETMYPIASRFAAGTGWQSFLQSQQASIGYLAGCLSGCTSLPEQAWHVALDNCLRPRDRRSAAKEFAVGRRETSQLPTSRL